MPVSERALLARINRKLAKDPRPRVVKKAAAGTRMQQEFGDYYAIDLYHNMLLDGHVSLKRGAKNWAVWLPGNMS